MNRLRELRIKLKLTQTQLSMRSGLSQAYINELESNKKKNPSINALSRLARAMEVPLSDLLNGLEKDCCTHEANKPAPRQKAFEKRSGVKPPGKNRKKKGKKPL